jgi:protein gp37
MVVINTNISWTTSTWGLATGCHKVSSGCDHCYAEAMVNRWPSFGHRFDEVKLHLDRLKDIRKFRPLVGPEGLLPHMVFVNSMSDFWHDAIPDDAIARILDVMEAHPAIIFQILTKRPIRARKILTARYLGKGIPRHIWIGVSTEDNRVAARLNIMRSIKQRTGSGTFFVSVEPIVGPTDALDFTDMDQVITGGESGPGARRMERAWLMAAVETAKRQGAALWHKQNGTHPASHPNIDKVPARIVKPAARFRWLRDFGWEVLPGEKGGGTIDRMTYRELPRAYYDTRDAMNASLLARRAGGSGTVQRELP